MTNGLPDVAFAVFVIGAIVVSATLARPMLSRFGLPDVVGYIVDERRRAFGDWAVSPELYVGMVIVTLGTCLASPPVAQYLLLRYPQE